MLIDRRSSTIRPWLLTVTDEEFHDIHHALRMLVKSWLPPKGEERERIEAAADSLWNAHCNRNRMQTSGSGSRPE